MITVLPAKRAATKELTKMRYGYYQAKGLALVYGYRPHKRYEGSGSCAYVPRKQYQHRPNRRLANISFEAFFRLAGGIL